MEKDNNTKIIISTLAGVAAGVVLGMFLWSPEKKELRADVLQKFDEGKDKLNDLLEKKEELMKMKEKVLSLVNEVEQKIKNAQ